MNFCSKNFGNISLKVMMSSSSFMLLLSSCIFITKDLKASRHVCSSIGFSASDTPDILDNYTILFSSSLNKLTVYTKITRAFMAKLGNFWKSR